MKRYRKKPIEVEALQWNGDNGDAIERWCPHASVIWSGASQRLVIIVSTLEGDMKANIGDYIVKGVEGEFYPCRGDIFEKTYEAVE